MINYKMLEKNIDEVITKLSKRNQDFIYLHEVNKLNEQRKQIILEVEKLKQQRNDCSKMIGQLIKNKSSEQEINKIKEEVNKFKDRIDQLDAEMDAVVAEMDSILSKTPNIPDDSVPTGKDEDDNVEVRKWGSPIIINNALEHFEIGTNLNIIDFEKAANMSGSRFVIYKGLGAKLQRALINFMLDENTSRGYQEMVMPVLVTPKTMYGTGQLPKFKDDAYYVEKDDLYLIPTSEVPLTNYHAGDVLKSTDLPKYFTAYSNCFRQESGSAGKDTKGIIRMHQFNKVEMVKLSKPETSMDELEKMVNDAENILQKLEIPYRVITLCGGDMGFSASKTYDIELWLAGQNKYREVSSCSNCKDFQARRMNLRFKNDNGDIEFVHTLNGSGLAIDRVIAAILENYQNTDGSVTVPKALRKYMNNLELIK